ncbi:UDP-N-acetylmuramate dehydrogenase [Agarivorans sp. TSD2052]|uniref:UDP-N-acetylmuramate dehydrogenase n=1 Tax=Agarivorans sp. TSD2052 TaxID=2937286 RepID=UPI00200D7588|nr:UDP-N-acetylmuramate dehydrogenase [Agarivorans sp. TSD2052]UPW19127.1 UDP-N-acetylmuramate dehydrogenase [Agarivorans sp. TSD2052]
MKSALNIQRQVSLRKFNSFGLDAKATFLFELDSQQQLPALFQYIRRHKLSWLIVGGGSNLLMLSDFDGLVIVNRMMGVTVDDSAEQTVLTVSAGENWHELVSWTVDNGYNGLENLALIPGTVGAAPVQNIGAYGLEIARYCSAVTYFDVATGQTKRLTGQACQFSYRDSIFKQSLKDQIVICEVELRLPTLWAPLIEYSGLNQLPANASARQVFDKVCELRASKLPDPEVLGNAGSFFKNPIINQQKLTSLLALYPDLPYYSADEGFSKVAAGWLIDYLGLKGFRVGDAAVHKEQALVLVNHGFASAADLIALCKVVRAKVWQAFAIVLEPEVRFIGAIEEVPPSSVLGQPNE